MEDVNEHEINDTIEPSATAGKRLKQAREAKNFTVAEVAVQLRFTKEVVTFLENQQWDQLPGRTYARGYFTNYVKFLGLPHDEMLATFNREYMLNEASPALTHYDVETSKPFPWVPVVLLALVLAVAWFSYQQWQLTQAAAVVNNPVPTTSSANDNLGSSGGESLDPSPAAANQDEQQQPTQLTSDSVANQSLLDEDSIDAEAQWADYNQIEQGGSLKQPVVNDGSVDTASNGMLEVAFTDQCWVEIKNGASKVLVNKVMNVDEHIKLSSQTPLQVLLGKASAASVTFNQKTVDLSPYMKGNVAHLTLGAAP